MQQNAWLILICWGSQLTFVDTEIMVSITHSQPTITHSKLTIDTLELGVKFVQS